MKNESSRAIAVKGSLFAALAAFGFPP